MSKILDRLTPNVRAWIYTILVAAAPLLIAYGILSEDTATLWVSLAAAILNLAAGQTARHHLTDTTSGGPQ